jgi:hypothetical protein
MQIYPEKYDKLDLTASERSFLRTMERAFSGDQLAYYVLKINPRKRDAGQGKAELFNMLVIPEGLLLLRFFDADVPLLALTIIKAMGTPMVYNTVEKDIKAKLEESKYLVNENGNLKHAINIMFVFPNIDTSQMENELSAYDKEFCHKHVLFKDDIQTIRKEGKPLLIDRLDHAEEVVEDRVNNLFQRLCPEITIPRKFILDDHATIAIKESALTQLDRAVQSYRLDSWQIDMVNKINKGNQLILACAGSGKSVLLISKCFKLASLNPAEDFLITCYNRNLNNYYQWAISQAGFIDRNVRCTTFLGLCKQLLESNGIPLPTSFLYQQNDYYDCLFEKANDALAAGQIKERFYGIFIDEVQIFKPEWYRFCFNLLKSKNDPDHYFVIAGDKSQDIKNNIKHGKAPWQGGGSDYPEYRGKTLPIERNYRNSKPINDAIDRFVSSAKTTGEAIGVDLTSDPELFLRGTAYRTGNKPSIIELQEFSNDAEAEAICSAIRSFLQKGYSEVDIAVIVYNRQSYVSKGWKTHYYNLLAPIKRIFFQENWEFPSILISGESDGDTYGSRRGVTIATIEGSLGLDFRAVVLAGLKPLGSHEKAQALSDFDGLTGEALAEKHEAFVKNINFLYTGCTRAKDELTIILSAPKGESIYMDLIRDTMGELK